jgi:hypothetical protein
MALNTSGPISIAGTTAGESIQVELNGNGTTQMSLNDTAVRTLAGVASGQIEIPTNFYGKANSFSFTISANQQEANLRTLALAAGWNGTSAAQATVGAGVYVWSDNTSVAGLTIDGSWPGGVTLTNNGYIIGKGGKGGTNGGTTAGAPGGPAISLGINATIVNNSGAFIAGGGGGGGGNVAGGGGGAGGGDGGLGRFTSPFGTGGSIGSSGSNGGQTIGSGSIGGSGGGAGGGAGGTIVQSQVIGGCGGGGGRILPGSGGAGGPGTISSGGAGGSAGDAGSVANPPSSHGSGGGGGWGASGGTASAGSIAGGAGGNAIALNGYSATTSGSGTIYGAVS